MTYREREAHQRRALETLVQASAFMLHPSLEDLSSALILTASALMHITALGGKRAVSSAMATISQLKDEGVLAP
jgi:hypothetical protein